MHAIQTKHTVHEVHRAEGIEEGAEYTVTVIARVQRRISLIYGRFIQKYDGSREEAVFESVGMYFQTFICFHRWKNMEESGWNFTTMHALELEQVRLAEGNSPLASGRILRTSPE